MATILHQENPTLVLRLPTLHLRAPQDTLSDLEVRREVENDIAQLAQHIRAIRDNFSAVSTILAKFDSTKFRNEFGTALELGPSWDTLKWCFDECVMLSLYETQNVIMSLQSISGILGEAAPTPPTNDPQLRERLIQHLNDFTETLSENEDGARHVQAQFRAIADDVQVLTEEISSVLVIADQNLQSELKTINDRLPHLQRELDKLRSKSRRCGGGSNRARRNELEREIAQVVSQRDAIRDDRIPELAEHHASLERHLPLVEDIANEINIIADIWGTVGSDTHGLVEYLKDNFAPGSPITRFWTRKLNDVKTSYTDLSRILDMYVVEATKAVNWANI